VDNVGASCDDDIIFCSLAAIAVMLLLINVSVLLLVVNISDAIQRAAAIQGIHHISGVDWVSRNFGILEFWNFEGRVHD
jgi:hypothetical protein